MCGNDPIDQFDTLGVFSFCRQNGEIRIAVIQKRKLVGYEFFGEF